MSGANGESKGLARSLGEFFGHLWAGVRADVTPARRHRPIEVGRVTMEHRVERGDAEVVLRRTVIDEVEVRPSPGGASEEA